MAGQRSRGARLLDLVQGLQPGLGGDDEAGEGRPHVDLAASSASFLTGDDRLLGFSLHSHDTSTLCPATPRLPFLVAIRLAQRAM